MNCIRCVVLAACGFLMSGVSFGQSAEDDSPNQQLTTWLQGRQLNDAELKTVSEQPWATKRLTKEESESAARQLWQARLEFLRKDREAEVAAREIVIDDLRMPFWYRSFGDAPPEGRRLFISMHGGGGAPAAVNDQQYENQKKLYEPAEGIYLVPRAATNTWDLWHQRHIDHFFDRLMTDMIVFENVNPDSIYLLGYSAGGDGVYQLAPRMADRIAAAAMMAGHPNETRPDGLRNIGFTLHMGADDSAYNRNKIAAEWATTLHGLRAADPQGYIHEVTIHEGRGHWMNRQDAVAVPWMSKFQRNVWPNKVVWLQDDVTHSRFYWLKVAADSAKAGDEVIAAADGNTIHIEKSTVSQITLLLDDKLVDLDHPVTVVQPDGSRSEYALNRSISSLSASLLERNDPDVMFSVAVPLDVKQH